MKLLITILLLTCKLIALGGEISEYYYKEAGQNFNKPGDRFAVFQKSRNHDEVASTNHGISEIGIERTGCFGTCPSYTFIAKSDGSLLYKGIEYIERRGEFTGMIEVGEFRRLAHFIRDAGYMDLESEYARAVTDNPSVFTTVVMRGKRKVVRNYANAGPTKLWAIEQLIDDMMRNAQWNESKSETNWTTLFNGKDLSGWKQVNDGTFLASNGVIHVEGGKGWLRTEKEYGDFVLEAEWRGLETNFNSGIFVRAPLDGNPWSTNTWQVNLKQKAVGELLEGDRKAVLSTTIKPVDEWVKYHVEARGTKLTLFINGERAWEFNELKTARGYIGIQAEGKKVEVRNLRLQEIPTGKDQ